MDKNGKRKRRLRPSARGLVQLYCALLYNAHVKGFVTGKLYTGDSKALCVPGLNCYSCPGAVAACPLGSLQNALAAAGHTTGWYVFGILLLFGVTLGRTVCGWLCPAGLIQELLHRIPTPKIRKGRATRALSYLKYAVLAVFVAAIPLYYGLAKGTPMPAFCRYICPAGTGEGAAALLAGPAGGELMGQLGLGFTRKFIILLAVCLGCIFCHRAFCRFLCPLGALYSLFNRFALTGAKVDASRCVRCGACVRACPMDIRHVGDRECVSCGKCVDSCAAGAISVRCGKIVLKGPETAAKAAAGGGRKARRITACVLAAALAAVLAAVNLPWSAPEVPAPPAEDAAEIPVGAEPGQRLEDFSCVLTDGTPFRLADTRGRVVFINQWATYCHPCVEELPYFERLRQEHPDIVVLAAHHWLEATPTAAEFIRSRGWQDWGVLFTVDTPDQNILNRINGDNSQPRTVVLNRKGVVVYNEQRSVTYEMLAALLEKAENE